MCSKIKGDSNMKKMIDVDNEIFNLFGAICKANKTKIGTTLDIIMKEYITKNGKKLFR